MTGLGQGRPYYWGRRIAICLACAAAVLVLCLVPGCDRPRDVAACYAKCSQLNPDCASETFARHLSPFNMEATVCDCRCSFAMPFADGGRP